MITPVSLIFTAFITLAHAQNGTSTLAITTSTTTSMPTSAAPTTFPSPPFSCIVGTSNIGYTQGPPQTMGNCVAVSGNCLNGTNSGLVLLKLITDPSQGCTTAQVTAGSRLDVYATVPYPCSYFNTYVSPTNPLFSVCYGAIPALLTIAAPPMAPTTNTTGLQCLMGTSNTGITTGPSPLNCVALSILCTTIANPAMLRLGLISDVSQGCTLPQMGSSLRLDVYASTGASCSDFYSNTKRANPLFSTCCQTNNCNVQPSVGAIASFGTREVGAASGVLILAAILMAF